MELAHILMVGGLLLGTPLNDERFYERTKIELQGHSKASIKTLLAAIAKARDGEKLYWQRNSNGRPRRLSDHDLKRLPRTGLIAFFIALQRDQRGSEADLVLPPPQAGLPPHFVTVLHEPNDHLILIYDPQQRRSFNHRHLPATERPIAVDGDRSWSRVERARLYSALARLQPAERKLIQQVSFVRHRVGQQGAHNAALHVSKGCRSHIRVFDSLFEDQPSIFTGSPEAPISTAEYGLLHEIGHAIANAPYKAASCALDREERVIERLRQEVNAATAKYNRRVEAKDRSLRQADVDRLQAQVQKVSQRIEAYNQARAKAKADRHMGPVRRRFERWTARSAPVTRYAMQSLDERFAEAFALSRTDPAAVQRIAPKVLKFFERFEHLKALQKTP